MEPPGIIFMAHGLFEQDLLKPLATDASREFGLPVQIREIHTDLTFFYDHTRRQYNANLLLKEMENLAIPGAVRKIGLFEVDLFIPILTFIFGQAHFRGTTGVVSTYRLRNEQYGLKPDAALLGERFRKVIIHELGHTFGLIHCQAPDCVMRSSTYVEDIDQKSHKFCPKCREELRH